MAGIGDLLRAELRRRELTQNQASRVMGVAQPSLSRWLAGEGGPPSTENCAKIAAFLDMPLVEVLKLTGRAEEEWFEGDPHGPKRDTDWDWVEIEPEIRDILEPYEREKWPSIVQIFRNVVDVMVPKPVPPSLEIVSSKAQPRRMRRERDELRGTTATRNYRPEVTDCERYGADARDNVKLIDLFDEEKAAA